MTTYYIRTTSPAQLLSLGVQIGVLRVADDGTPVLADPHVGIWDPIGEIQRPTGGVRQTDMGEAPVMAPVCDEQVVPYWHANLMLYAGDLTGLAQAAYAADPNPDLAAAIGQIPSYFMIDESTGEPLAPNAPAQVFA